jgi:hypothetical protein
LATRKENTVSDNKNAMEMTDAEFDAAVRGWQHRAHAARQKAEEDAFMANFLARNPDVRPKAADPTDPPATPEPEPPKTTSTSSTDTPPPPRPMRATSAMDMSDAEWDRALARINSTGQLP